VYSSTELLSAPDKYSSGNGDFAPSAWKQAIAAASPGFVDGAGPGIETHVNLRVKDQRSKITVVAAHVMDWRRQVEGLLITCFHGADKGADVRQVPQVQK